MPIELIDSGLARQMGGSEVKRFITLLRMANFECSLSFARSLTCLASIDSVSSRRAHEINAKLEERHLVQIERGNNPYVYRILLPEKWLKPPARVELAKSPRVRGEERVERADPPPWR